MAIDYVAAAATATRVISENGRLITLQKPSVTPADPAKPWGARTTTAAETVPNVRGVFLGPVKSHSPLAVNAGLMILLWTAWDKYALPVLAALWYLKAAHSLHGVPRDLAPSDLRESPP